MVTADLSDQSLCRRELNTDWDFKGGVFLEIGIISNSLGSGDNCKLCLEIFPDVVNICPELIELIESGLSISSRSGSLRSSHSRVKGRNSITKSSVKSLDISLCVFSIALSILNGFESRVCSISQIDEGFKHWSNVSFWIINSTVNRRCIDVLVVPESYARVVLLYEYSHLP